MTHPVRAKHYADAASCHRVVVTENVPLARDTYRVRFDCPSLARTIVPGQFVMVRIADAVDPLLGRPFALYDVVVSESGEPTGLDIVYLVLGKMTSRLAKFVPGQSLEVWGPLGNGFAPQPTDHLIMVAGGIGQTPFVAVAQEALGHRTYGDPPRTPCRTDRVTLCYGARAKDYLAGVPDFERLGVDVRISTDDGSVGHHGRVTDLLNDTLQTADPERVVVVCCGPEPMMEAVAQITSMANVPCYVSLETPMACGIGICFSCVTKVRDFEQGWDYKRTCVDGPVFCADQIIW